MEPEWEEGGIPVYKPTYEDFRDFNAFVKRVEPVGMTSGIIKVIPPREWLEKLPKLDEAAIDKTNAVRRPIAQIPMGGNGVYTIQNVEKRHTYKLSQWLKMSSTLCNQPPAPRGFPQYVVGNAQSLCKYDDGDFSAEKCQELEAAYWKTLGLGVGEAAALYGADMPGSLFNDETKEWNVSQLDSILKVLGKKIPGVTTSYLYCGMWRATFTWHLEDMDLPSINYIHFGAPKQWYTVPQSHHEELYRAMVQLFPEAAEECPEFLRHKTFLVDPKVLRRDFGIPVYQTIHRQHEFMITFPYGYHAGFNYGYNCAESVNFGTEAWLDIGLKSHKCLCVNHSVSLDMITLAQKLRPEPPAPQPERKPKQPKLPRPPKLPKAPKEPKAPKVKKEKEPKPKRKLKYAIDEDFWNTPAQHNLLPPKLPSYTWQLTHLGPSGLPAPMPSQPPQSAHFSEVPLRSLPQAVMQPTHSLAQLPHIGTVQDVSPVVKQPSQIDSFQPLAQSTVPNAQTFAQMPQVPVPQEEPQTLSIQTPQSSQPLHSDETSEIYPATTTKSNPFVYMGVPLPPALLKNY